jgi:hypothetical protein
MINLGTPAIFPGGYPPSIVAAFLVSQLSSGWSQCGSTAPTAPGKPALGCKTLKTAQQLVNLLTNM